MEYQAQDVTQTGLGSYSRMSESTDSDTQPQGAPSHGDIYHGDAFQLIPEFDDDTFHAVVTDPPYNYEGGFMGNEWDNIGSAS